MQESEYCDDFETMEVNLCLRACDGLEWFASYWDPSAKSPLILGVRKMTRGVLNTYIQFLSYTRSYNPPHTKLEPRDGAEALVRQITDKQRGFLHQNVGLTG